MNEDQLPSTTVELLKSIRDEIVGLRGDTNARFEKLEGRICSLEKSLHDEMSELRAEGRRGFMLLDSRFESLKTTAGNQNSAVDMRVHTLENQMHSLQKIVDRIAILVDDHSRKLGG